MNPETPQRCLRCGSDKPELRVVISNRETSREGFRLTKSGFLQECANDDFHGHTAPVPAPKCPSGNNSAISGESEANVTEREAASPEPPRCADTDPDKDCPCGGRKGMPDCMFPDSVKASVPSPVCSECGWYLTPEENCPKCAPTGMCESCGARLETPHVCEVHIVTAAPTGTPDPYPFDEIVDDKQAVRFNMDGTKWCANRLPFTNMMEMACGFGDTPMQALVDLITQEATELHAPTATGEGSEPPRCPSCNSDHPLADGSWAVPCDDPWHKPAMARCICGEPDADHGMAAGKLHHQITTTEGCQSCAALRSQLEERTRELADEHSADAQIQEQYAAPERDLATAQARIAALENKMTNEELRQHENDMIAHFTNAAPDGCVCGMCEAVRNTAKSLAEPQSGEK